MFETFGFEDTTAREVSVLFALAIGVLFGALAQLTRFCFRRALAGDDRRRAAGVWAMALAVAVLGTQAAVAQGWISFADHRLLTGDLPLLAIAAGGLMFGGGMILTRGCASRLVVLAGSGNLRALLVIAVFAVTAHATLKGVLAPLRTALGSVTLPLGEQVSLAALPGGALLWSALIAAAALAVALRSGNRLLTLGGGALIGLLVPLAWVGTGFVLFDEFDPIAMESLSFTSPAADTLFFVIASSSIPAGFGPGLIGGVLLGALAASLLSGSFQWQSFESPRQTGRYLTGAVLMGTGGVLAGGCTVGAGLAGIPTLSIAAVLALAFIALGGIGMNALLNAASSESAGSPATPARQPAE
ncbi:YeeE/YedE family protein [Leisingera sp. HS039]|uniref:YeeE/YedE family protein n=1 Tax=unclassified Leisingera TaxID=2614906 RepID=UPI001070C8A6|nr:MULTISPECIES: YeeE/YedE family protein [unclassified Leisingera]MBQ4825304.1 YeeE/YedE family protein [Leisingera sp. HS039]QBR35869.1 YeeE/YedE family protein [Leisingera sp. NJS201]